MTDATAALASINALQIALQMIQTLTPIAWRFPPNCAFENGGTYDFVIVGGGSAGCVLANRLSANFSVLLIEAGGYPPIESELSGWFTLLANSVYDFNLTSQNDGRTAQYLQGQVVSLTQGKMLGGSSGLQHLMHTHGDPEDFNTWDKMIDDNRTRWNYDSILPFYIQMEKLIDQELLNSPYASLHGTDGPMRIQREMYPETASYLAAFEELGNKIVKDISSSESSVGYGEILFEIADEKRQSSALAYLGPIKERSNLCLSLFTTATKILIDNKSKKAYGVQVTTASGDLREVYAKNEVIVAAGAINTPKLLMLSGIGPKNHLESLGINVVANLPVGQNFQDHACAPVLYQMDENYTPSPAANPTKFPAPAFNGYVNLDPSHSYADYETINMRFGPNSTELLQLCVNMFKYSTDVCQLLYNATINRNTMFSLVGLVMPNSRGHLLLSSSNPADPPLIYTGVLSDPSDVELLGKAFQDHNRILNTTFFKSVSANLVDAGLCKDATTETEFWKCYAVKMSATMWHYAGTCAMGKVLDSQLRVKGVDALRVVDASAMPTLIRGKIYAAVMLIAEHATDIILKAWTS